MHLLLSDEDKSFLLRIARDSNIRFEIRRAANILLALGLRRSNVSRIANRFGIHKSTVSRWARRWRADGRNIFEVNLLSFEYTLEVFPKSQISLDDLDVISIDDVFEGTQIPDASIWISQKDGRYAVYYSISTTATSTPSEEPVEPNAYLDLDSSTIKQIQQAQSKQISKFNKLRKDREGALVELSNLDLRNLLEPRKGGFADRARDNFQLLLRPTNNIDLKKLGDALLDLSEDRSRPYPLIAIYTTSFFVAWNYLYLTQNRPSYKESALKWINSEASDEARDRAEFLKGFWGFRFRTSIRLLPNEGSYVTRADPEIDHYWNFPENQMKVPTPVGLLYDISSPDIEEGVKLEVDAVKNNYIKYLQVHDFFDQYNLDGDFESVLEALVHFFTKQNFEIIYLAFHHDEYPSGGTRIAGQFGFSIGKDTPYEILGSQIWSDEKMQHRPRLVIANACSTSRRTQESRLNLVRYFADLGALGFLVTEGKIDSNAGSRIMILLLDAWLGSQIGLGTILSTVRRDLLKSDVPADHLDALISLAYSLYAPSNLVHA